jgi:hypothetical protein
MKIYGASLLALCALHSASGFVLQTPKTQATKLDMSTRVRDEIATRQRVRGGEIAPDGPMRRPIGDFPRIRDIWDSSYPELVQGGSLRTWSFASPLVEQVQVMLKTEGRPLNANVELWQGPDNSPQKMGVYIEDGSFRPFSAVIFTPRGSNAIAIRNTGMLEFPLAAAVEPADTGGLGSITRMILDQRGRTIQGGAVYTEPFSPLVESVCVALKTDGRPLTARIELLQGPNNNKQVIELYTEDGLERPFFSVIETPGTGNVVRIVNTATVEFPLTCSIEPYTVEPGYAGEPISSMGGAGAGYSQGRPMF